MTKRGHSEHGFLVYALVDPRDGEIRYVGKCRGYLNSRVRGHLREARETDTRTYKLAWLRQLLDLGLEPEGRVLERCIDADALAETERRWIADLRERGVRLTNLTDGGEGMANPSEETREKLRKRPQVGWSSAAREAARRRMKQRWADPEIRAVMLAQIEWSASRRRGTGASPRSTRGRRLQQLGSEGLADWKRENARRMTKLRMARRAEGG